MFDRFVGNMAKSLEPFYSWGFDYFHRMFDPNEMVIMIILWAVPIFFIYGIMQYARIRSTQGMAQGTRNNANRDYNASRPRKKDDKGNKPAPYGFLAKADGAWGKLLLNRHLWRLLFYVMGAIFIAFIVLSVAWFGTHFILAYARTGQGINQFTSSMLSDIMPLIIIVLSIVIPILLVHFLFIDFFLTPHFQKVDSFWNNHLVKNRKTASIRKGSFSDVRNLDLKSDVKYDPLDYFAEAYNKKSVFLGLTSTDSGALEPIYIDKKLWDKSNVQIVGVMGSGKGVQASNALYQCLKYYNDAVIVFDPKNDEFAPHVLKSAGTPFKLIDLNSDKPQFNLFANIGTSDLIELLESGFNLGVSGTDSDFYRNFDRKAVRAIAEQFPDGTNAQELLQAVDNIPKELRDNANNLLPMLEELCRIPVLQTEYGGELEEVIEKGGCLYFIGATRKNDVIMLQKMILTRCIQLIEQRDRFKETRHVNIFLDEFKHMISKEALDGMGTLRDKNGNFLIAHQSLGDLKRPVGTMDGEAVKQTVLDTTPLKWIYRAKDAEGANWASDQTGQIIAENARTQIDSSTGGAEMAGAVQEITEAQRNLIDTTTIQHLPDGCGLVISTEVAKIGYSSTIKVTKVPIKISEKPGLAIANKFSELIERESKNQPTDLSAVQQVANQVATLSDSAPSEATTHIDPLEKLVGQENTGGVRDNKIRIDF